MEVVSSHGHVFLELATRHKYLASTLQKNNQMHFTLKLLSVLFILSNSRIWAHGPGVDHIGFSSWNFLRPVTFVLLLLTALYYRGWKKLTRHSNPHAIRFILGMISLIVALISPIDSLSDKLASVHMIQHTLLMMVAAPLFILSYPGLYGPLALPRFIRGTFVIRWSLKIYQFRRPVIIWILYALTLWIWHLPVLYEEALQNSLVHDLQHIAFFMSSFLFWRVVLDPRGKRKLDSGVGVLYLFVASLHAMILGVFMALSPVPWYAPYVLSATQYGLTPLEDQQLAGFIMWMPAGTTYFLVALGLIYRLLRFPKE